MSHDYTALIVDLKSSRSYSIDDRSFIQHHILDVISLLNHLFCRQIVREVDFSAGDEIQGLFASPQGAYLYLRMFSMCIHPVEIRAGIGVGSWDVQIDHRGTTSQDGTAYHNARYAIKNADDLAGYPILFYSGYRQDITINTIIGGTASIMSKLSINQNQLMLMTELLAPICDGYTRIYENVISSDIKNLLYVKSTFDHNIEKNSKPFPLDRIRYDFNSLVTEYDYEQFQESSSFFITSGKQRGIPTKLASILDIRRQTIERAIKSGNIYAARNMAISAIIEMSNIGWER